MVETAADQVAGQASALVLSSSVGTADRAPCLYFVGIPDRALVISYVRSPSQWVVDWRAVHATLPEELAILAPGDWPGDDLPPQVRLEPIASPGDLTGQGIRISEYLDRWKDEGVVICFDSLTTLLPYGELHQVYRFVHLLASRLEDTDARVLFDLDPETVDERTVATLISAVRAVVRQEGDEWVAQTR